MSTNIFMLKGLGVIFLSALKPLSHAIHLLWVYFPLLQASFFFNLFVSFLTIWVLSILEKEKLDLIILDIILPQIDGYKVCRILRKFSRVPIILLTALANTPDRIRGIDLGADEYLTKPFAPDELEACIRSLLTRSRKRNDFNPLVIQVGDLKLDIIKKHVFKGNKLIRLTLIEFNLFI